jgi:hypothetical protein
VSDLKIIRFHEMNKYRYQKNADAMNQATLGRWQMVLRSFNTAFALEHFPFVVLVVLAALSLLSRLWLLKH